MTITGCGFKGASYYLYDTERLTESLKEKSMSNVKATILSSVNAALGIFETAQDASNAMNFGDWIGHADESEVETNFINMFSKAEIEELTGVEGFEEKWDAMVAELNIEDLIEAMSSEMAQRTLDMMAGQDCVCWFSSDEWKTHVSR